VTFIIVPEHISGKLVEEGRGESNHTVMDDSWEKAGIVPHQSASPEGSQGRKP